MSSPAWLGNLPRLPLCEIMCRFSYSARLAVPPPFLLFNVKLSYRSPHLMLGKKAEKCLSYNYSCEETMRLCECSSCVPSRLRCNPSDFKQGFQGEVGDSGSSNQLEQLLCWLVYFSAEWISKMIYNSYLMKRTSAVLFSRKLRFKEHLPVVAYFLCLFTSFPKHLCTPAAWLLKVGWARSYFRNCLDRKTYSRLALYISGSSILKSLREAHTHLKAAKWWLMRHPHNERAPFFYFRNNLLSPKHQKPGYFVVFGPLIFLHQGNGSH